MLIRWAVYATIPAVLWTLAVLGYTLAYGTFLTSISFPAIFPAFFSVYLAGSVPAIGFLVTAWSTMSGRTQVGQAFIVSVVIVGLLVVVWFILSWDYGVQIQGASVVYQLAILNLLTLAGLLIAVWALMPAPNLWGKFFLHTVLWVWIGWFAFPTLGEYP